jgi:hypothetical protein
MSPVIDKASPLKLVGRKFHRERTVIRVGDVTIGGQGGGRRRRRRSAH